MMKLLLLSLVLSSVTSVYAGAEPEDPISVERQTELLHLLKQDCGSCHGLTMKGGLGTPLLPENLQNKPVSLLTATILYGRPGTAMPPWQALVNANEAKWLATLLKQGLTQ